MTGAKEKRHAPAEVGSATHRRAALTAAWLILTTLLPAGLAGCASPRPIPPEVGSREPAARTLIYLVRHAEKTSERGDAELTEAGKRRASTLAWMLHDVPIDAVYSTDFRRTRDTAGPVATARGLDITLYTANDELIQILEQKHGGHTVFVCGHSNTIPQLLSELGLPIQDKILAGYDDLFVVTLRWESAGEKPRPTLQRLHYVRTTER